LPGAFFGEQQALGDEGRRHAAFAAGMGELNAGSCTLGLEELGDALEGGDVLVFPDTEVAGGDAAFRGYSGGLESDQACAALSACAEVDQMPVGGEAVYRGVLAHGGDADAIGEFKGAELEGGKKRMGHGLLDVRDGLRMHGRRRSVWEGLKRGKNDRFGWQKRAKVACFWLKKRRFRGLMFTDWYTAVFCKAFIPNALG